jgi:hypothetical protein
LTKIERPDAWQVARLHAANPTEITAAHVRAANQLIAEFSANVADSAFAAVGTSAAHVLTIVVINNRSIAKLAEALRMRQDRAFGQFTAAIERLREHYHPPIKRVSTWAR